MKSVLLFFILFIVVGCTSNVKVYQRGYYLANGKNSETPIHPYPGSSKKTEYDGNYVVILFSSVGNLETLAEQKSHHLYFDLVSCSKDDIKNELWSGQVLLGNNDSGISITSFGPNEGLYKVYIPDSIAQFRNHISGYGAIEPENYLEQFTDDQLCIELGGAKMWGFPSLTSNKLKTPIKLNNTKLSFINTYPKVK